MLAQIGACKNKFWLAEFLPLLSLQCNNRLYGNRTWKGCMGFLDTTTTSHQSVCVTTGTESYNLNNNWVPLNRQWTKIIQMEKIQYFLDFILWMLFKIKMITKG